MTELSPMYYDVPEYLNITSWAVDRWIERGEGSRRAVITDTEVLTFSRLFEVVNKYGNALKKLGINRGDRVVVRSLTRVESIASLLALMKIGAVPIPLSTLLGPSEIGYILRDPGACGYIATSDLLSQLAQVAGRDNVKHQLSLDGASNEWLSLPQIAEEMSSELEAANTRRDDIGFILYSTGTTGLPKGIVHGHQFIIGAGEPMGRRWLALSDDDVVMHPHELSFSYTWSAGFLVPLYCGVPIAIFGGRLSAPDVLMKHIDQKRVTVFCSVPTVYRSILACDAARSIKPSSLRRCISAGEPLPAETSQQWQEVFGVSIYDGIGTSETFLFCAHVPGMQIKHGSIGKPLPGFEVAIIDEDGAPKPPGEIGFLAIKEGHPSLLLSYLGLESKWEQSRKAGWFLVGDYAFMDEDGYFWYHSRQDDIIKSRGYLISPREVEDAIQKHQYVAESGVIGIPAAITGQKVKAFIVLKEGVPKDVNTAREIREFVRSEIALFKAPKVIEFVDQLPRSMTGKLLRRKLRDVEAESAQSNEPRAIFEF